MNYLSTQVAVTTSEVSVDIGVDTPSKYISGIQNNTGGVVTIKFNGGTGEFLLPAGAYFEPFEPIHGVIIISGVSAGNCCFLG